MRQKSYYNPSDIILNQYTFGKEWQLENDTEYIGTYHRYISTGEIYTGEKWNSQTSKRLIPYFKYDADVSLYKKLKPRLFTNYETFSISSYNTLIDTGSDSITRFFLKKVNELYVYEVDTNTYKKWNSKQIDPNLYIGYELIWYIKGNISREYVNGTFKDGVVEKNKKELERAELVIPGISKKLNNLTEYYVDTDIITPKDING